MLIADNCKTTYLITIPETSSVCNIYAADELKNFIFKATGAALNVVQGKKLPQNEESGNSDRSCLSFNTGNFISIGNTDEFKEVFGSYDFTRFGSDGYIIKSCGGNIFINGGTDRAVLFGVYGFLEKYLKIRFIAADTTHIECFEKLILPDVIDLEDIPDFAMRGYLEASMYDEEGAKHPLCDYDFALRKKAHHSFLFPDQKHGGRCTYWGRGECHNFHLYVSPEIYDNPDKPETYHPEFFYKNYTEEKVQDGLIVTENDLTICLTNGITDDGKLDESMDISVAKVVIEQLKQDIISHPDIIYFNFDQEDGQIKCECDRCRAAAEKYKRSGVLIRFCNVVAEEIRKWADKELGGRKVYLVTFAYSYTLEAPVKEENGETVPIDKSVIPCENLIMRMAVGRNCYYSYFDERQAPAALKAIKNWKKVSKRFFCWIYDCMFDRFLYFVPSLHTIDDNIEGFKKFGTEYLMIQGGHNVGGLWQSSMHSYIYMAKMWDSTVKTEDLAEEFMYYYFGAEGKKSVKEVIKKFYELYDVIVPAGKAAIWSMGGMEKKEAFPKDLLIDVLNIIKDAREKTALAEKDKEKAALYDKHLSQVQLNAIYPLLEKFFYYFPEKNHDDYIKFAKEWVELCDYAGVVYYSESTTVKSFADENYVFPSFFDYQ